MWLVGNTERWIMNNLCIYLGEYSRLDWRPFRSNPRNLQIDGNLHWCPEADAQGHESQRALLRRLHDLQQTSGEWKEYLEMRPDGWAAHSLVADPGFMRFGLDPAANNDYRLQPGSPAADAGVELPGEWADPLAPEEGEKRDIGALPVGAEKLRVGRFGRFQVSGSPE